MFPLAGKNFPSSSDELATSIQDALAEVFTMPTKKNGVTVDGAKFPQLKTVRINLSGATISAREPPPKPKPTGKRQPGVRVAKLEVIGQPIQYEQTKLNLKVTGSGLAFDFARDKKGHPLLILADAEDGKVEAKITKKDIETLLTEAANVAARQQGITIQDLDLELTQQGPRSVAAKVRVKAKKMLMSGTIVITGKLDIDDELNATVSDLGAKGEGVVGTLAAGIVQKHLKPYDGTSVPLLTFSLGDVALRDLKIRVKDSVEVSAAFGKEN
jgi:hypothetical protein